MKVAIVYDRVNKWGGAERVLLTLQEMFPKAHLYTSVYDKKNADWAKMFLKIRTSNLQKFKFLRDKHEYLAGAMPFVFESFNFKNYDLVISVTSEFGKAVVTGPKTLHICYLLTPTRYLWSHYDEYFANKFLKFISWPVISYLRFYDKQISQRPDVVVAISTEVQRRIKKYYGRESVVIYPPVGKLGNKIQNIGSKKYYLVVSRLVKYKRIDLVIEAFNKLGLPLVVVGTGREESHLKEMAKENIKFVGFVDDNELASYYKNCKAFVFPQEEDFGIVLVEAMGFGKPVIAYKAGGALDTVIDGVTGVFFKRQIVDSLVGAVKKCDRLKFNPFKIKNHARKFSKNRFKKEFLEIIQNNL